MGWEKLPVLNSHKTIWTYLTPHSHPVGASSSRSSASPSRSSTATWPGSRSATVAIAGHGRLRRAAGSSALERAPAPVPVPVRSSSSRRSGSGEVDPLGGHPAGAGSRPTVARRRCGGACPSPRASRSSCVGLPVDGLLPGQHRGADGKAHWLGCRRRTRNPVSSWAAVELQRSRGQGGHGDERRLPRVPRRRADDAAARQERRVTAAGGRSGSTARPAERLRHADGADDAAVLHRRLHRVAGGPLLRGVDDHAVPLPHAGRAVARRRRTRSATCPTRRSTSRPASSTCRCSA